MSHYNINNNGLYPTTRLLLGKQGQKMINDHSPKIDQDHSVFEEDPMTKLKACKTCGEIGHTSRECTDEWPHGHTRRPDKGRHARRITCFLCEGTMHVPIQCQLYPLVQQASQQTKEGMQQYLMKILEEQNQKVESKKDLSHVRCYRCKDTGHYVSGCPEWKRNKFLQGPSGKH
jgi:hypothetical protein